MKSKLKSIIKYIIKLILTLFLIPILILFFLPLILLKYYIKKGVYNFPFILYFYDKLKIHILYDHYYEPLINPKSVINKRSLETKRDLKLNFDIPSQINLVNSFDFKKELIDLEKAEIKNVPKYYYQNSNFESGDSEFYYSLIRKLKPSKIIEIGSGNSTKVALHALNKNKIEFSKEFTLTCIEPYEAPWINEVKEINLIRKKVECVDIEIFSQLSENDILFIDSSHIIRPQGDVVFEILSILPLVKKGVYIHIHDIFTPYDYCYNWLVNYRLFWNEQYILEAYLLDNPNIEIIASLNYLSHDHAEVLSEAFPNYKQRKGCDLGSFWIKKV
jgi:hypothetical protein